MKRQFAVRSQFGLFKCDHRLRAADAGGDPGNSSQPGGHAPAMLRSAAWQAAAELAPVLQAPVRREPAGKAVERRALPRARTLCEGLESRTLLSVSMDPQGWTVVTPSADSRIVYVSTSGKDSNSGLSPTQPVATVGKARTLVRSGAPDWVVFRRGDVFENQRFTSWNFSGRSAQEPFVVGAYTDPNAPSSDRPQFNTGIQSGVAFGASGASHLFFMGLAFEAHHRDFRDRSSIFNNSYLQDWQLGTYGVNGTGPLHNILVEDSSFQYYKSNLVFQNGAQGSPSDIRVRRNVISDAWAVNIDGFGIAMGSDTASLGLYTDQVKGLTVDGNTFHHNGWVEDDALGARRSLYSHNLYLNTGNENVSVTNNIIADAASHGLQMRAGGVVSNNLFLRNPIAMSYGHVNGAVKAGGVSGEISDNVIVGSSAIFTSPRGWGIEIGNLKPLSHGGGTAIRNNIFANDNQSNSAAIKLEQPNTTVPDVGINDLSIEGNIIYSWWRGLYIHPSYNNTRPLTNLMVQANDFQRISGAGAFIENNAPYAASEQHWRNNRYDGVRPETSTNKWFKISGQPRTFAEWAGTVEPTAIRAQGIFPAPGRTAGDYNATVGGTNSTDAFIRQAQRQSKLFWRTKYTAEPVLDYIRAGYTGGKIDIAAPTASADADNITVAGDAFHTFTVTYADDNKLDLSSLGSGDVQVEGPSGYVAAATLVASTGPADGSRRTATYRVAAPAEGKWSNAANGLYSILVQPGQVTDVTGKSEAADVAGSFSVSIEPGVPAAVATVAPVLNDTEAARISVTYTGSTSPGVRTSVSPVNAGFETPNVGGEAGGLLYNPVGGAWTFAGSAGLSADGTAFTTGNPPAPQGAQVAFLQTDGVIAQRVTGWQAGVYTISFHAAQRGNHGAPVHDFAVRVDGKEVGTFRPAGTEYGTYTTASFEIGDGDHLVEFVGINTDGGDNASFIDDVQIIGTTHPTSQVISAATFDRGDLRVTGPAGYTAAASQITVADAGDGQQRTVVYTVPAPANGWFSVGASALAVFINESEVAASSGATVPAGRIGTMSIGVSTPIVAAVNASDIPSGFNAPHTFTVTYVDNAPGKALADSVGSSDLRVTGPSGFNQPVTLVSFSGDGSPVSPLIAAYTVASPATGWGAAANGAYWITAQPNQIIDSDGNALRAGPIDSFRVAVDVTAPLAWAAESNITNPAIDAKIINVSYYDASGINASTIDGSDIRVIGPNGFSSAVTRQFSSAGPQSAYAEYVLPARNGKWQSAHNGVYSIVLQPNQVTDGRGNAASAANTITTFTVNLETIRPTVSLSAITTPRSSAIASLPIVFSEPVSGFGLEDLSLTRNGSPVSLASATLITSNNVSYTLGNLASLTATSGNYTLTLKGAGVADTAGNTIADDASIAWTMDETPPQATASAATISSPTTSPMHIQAIYTDAIDVNTSTIGAGDIRVVGPNGFNAPAGFVSSAGVAGNRTANYTLAAPSGGWKSVHNGVYSIVLQANQIADTLGNVSPAAAIGTFTVALETTAPTVAISPVLPSPRVDPVFSVTINFSETVSGFDLADLTLTRDGVIVSMSGATLSSSNGQTFTLAGLDQATTPGGAYVLTVMSAGRGIVDTAGNALTTPASIAWVIDASTRIPTITTISPAAGTPFLQNLSITGVDFPRDAAVVLRDPQGVPLEASIVSRSVTEIVVAVRLGDVGGNFSVEVTGSLVTSGPVSFEVPPMSPLTVDGVLNSAGTAAALSVRNAIGIGLSYTWSVLSGAAEESVVAFSANGGPGAANTTATFTGTGIYHLQVAVADGVVTRTNVVEVSVATVRKLVIAPSSVTLTAGNQQQFTFAATDQFGRAVEVPPAVEWRVAAGGVGAIDGTGLYSVPASTSGTATVIVSSGSTSDSAIVTVAPATNDVSYAKIDFAPANSAVSQGYQQDAGAVFGSQASGLAYGWTVSHANELFDRNLIDNQLLDTVVSVKKGAKWELAVPNGTYTVLVGAGDAGSATAANVWVEGQYLMNYVPLAANEFVSRSVSVAVSDGMLTLGIGGGAEGTTRLTHVEVTSPNAVPSVPPPPVSPPPVSPPPPPPIVSPPPPTSGSGVRVNFQPATAPTVAGYLVDSGATYGARNGQTFGWTTSHTTNAFDRNVNANQLLDTTMLVRKGARWDLAVPAGTYTVTVSAGDAAATSNANIWIEGKLLMSYVPLSANKFITRSITVNVTDGKLTLGIGSAADSTTRLNFIDVQPA